MSPFGPWHDTHTCPYSVRPLATFGAPAAVARAEAGAGAAVLVVRDGFSDMITTLGNPRSPNALREMLPDANARYCLPPASYVTMPPASAPPVFTLCTTSPVLLNTSRLPARSPVNVMPPAVGVTPAITG